MAITRATTRPPRGVKRMALATRLTITWSSRSSSPRHVNSSPDCSRSRTMPAWSARGRSSSTARATTVASSSRDRWIGRTPARRRVTSRIWFTSPSRRSEPAAMISTSRRCLSVSGPETRSRRRWAPSRMEVSGDRSSWETDAKNSSFVPSRRRSSRAIALNERASSPISSRLSTVIGRSKWPAATSAVAAESVPSDSVRRCAMSPLPSSASWTTMFRSCWPAATGRASTPCPRRQIALRGRTSSRSTARQPES